MESVANGLARSRLYSDDFGHIRTMAERIGSERKDKPTAPCAPSTSLMHLVEDRAAPRRYTKGGSSAWRSSVFPVVVLHVRRCSQLALFAFDASPQRQKSSASRPHARAARNPATREFPCDLPARVHDARVPACGVFCGHHDPPISCFTACVKATPRITNHATGAALSPRSKPSRT